MRIIGTISAAGVALTLGVFGCEGNNESLDAGRDASAADAADIPEGNNDAGIVQDSGIAGGDAKGDEVADAGPSSELPWVASNVPNELGLAAEAAFDPDSSCKVDTDLLAWTCEFPPRPAPTIHKVQTTSGDEVALIYVQRFTLRTGRSVYALGQRPLVIIASDAISISGTVGTDASKANGFAAGGAAGPTAAARRGFGAGGGAGGTAQTGGNGGSYCGLGGQGKGNANAPAAPYGTPEIVPLTGGSTGGSSGGGAAAAGGALQLIAGNSLAVTPTGVIQAVGLGTTSSASYAYAGGASGGAILLEAANVAIDGTLSVNGSGGVGSADLGGSGWGSLSEERAAFGGSAGALVDGLSGEKTGGGGGAGRIRINSVAAIEHGPTQLITPSRGTVCYSEGILEQR